MTSYNHAVTGALVAVAIKQPAIAFPVAVASHFLFDAVPHWDHKVALSKRKITNIGELIFTSLLVIILSLVINAPYWLTVSCMILAISPDIMWLPGILHGKLPAMDGPSLLHKVRRFHKKIQWSETGRGFYYEAIWFAAFLVLVLLFGR